MTVYDYLRPSNPLPAQVLTSYGTPVVGERRETFEEAEAVAGVTYEAHFELNPQPRELTAREAAILLPQVARQFALEHPEVVIQYADVRRGSPQLCVVQFTAVESSPIPPLKVIIFWAIMALVTAAVAVIVGVVVAPALKILYEIIVKPIPEPIRWLIYLIPVGILAAVGYVVYKRITAKPPPKKG